jgi:S1-C subfamily serine protease
MKTWSRYSSHKVIFTIVTIILITGLLSGCNFPLAQNQSLTGLNYTVTAPAEVKAGENFQISVNVTNNGQSTIMVDQIRLPKALLQGATVASIDPISTGQTTYSDQTGYTFTLIQEPGTSTTVTFNLTAVTAGDYSGNLSVAMGDAKKDSTLRVVIQAENGQVAQTTPQTTAASQATNAAGTTGGISYHSVVEIVAEVDDNGTIVEAWHGSGTIISADGLILTNAHVVLDDGPVKVQGLKILITQSADNAPVPTYYADILQADANLDLAVIKISRDLNGNPVDNSTLNLPAVPLGDSNALQLGDALTILGYPGIGGETITLTRGDVSGFTSDEEYGNRSFIKTSASISGGNSGGSALNSSGQIIGVPTQVGSGGKGNVVDCRALADTNGDGVIDNKDTCVPIGGFINAIRPIQLALPLINAAKAGQVSIVVPTPVPFAPSGDVIFQDNFTTSHGDWYTDTFEEGSVEIQNGQMVIDIKPTQYAVFTGNDKVFSDVQISVDTQVLQSSGVGEYGIVCNGQDNDNFYLLSISEDGYYSISIYYQGEWHSMVDWTYSDQIVQGAPATITATCAHDKLSLAYNDVLLTEVEDNTFQSGFMGFYVYTYDQPNMTIGFDNLVIRQQ